MTFTPAAFTAHLVSLTDEQRSDVLMTLAGYADTRPEEPVGSVLAACMALLERGVVDACRVPS